MKPTLTLLTALLLAPLPALNSSRISGSTATTPATASSPP
jgi:hypothetical protein